MQNIKYCCNYLSLLNYLLLSFPLPGTRASGAKPMIYTIISSLNLKHFFDVWNLLSTK